MFLIVVPDDWQTISQQTPLPWSNKKITQLQTYTNYTSHNIPDIFPLETTNFLSNKYMKLVFRACCCLNIERFHYLIIIHAFQSKQRKQFAEEYSFIPLWIGLEHQHGRRFFVLVTNMAAVTSSENAIYHILNWLEVDYPRYQTYMWNDSLVSHHSHEIFRNTWVYFQHSLST